MWNSRSFLMAMVMFLFLSGTGTGQITIYDTPCDNTDSLSKVAIGQMALYGEENNPKVIMEPGWIADKLVVKLKDTHNWDLMVFNCKGKLVKLGLLKPGKNKISMTGLPPGTYYVYMSNGDDRWVKKVRKES